MTRHSTKPPMRHCLLLSCYLDMGDRLNSKLGKVVKIMGVGFSFLFKKLKF